MSNKPQVATEEIELIPHPMDAWRAALDLLIACAPGDGPAIAAHLVEASKAALVCVNRTGATPGVAKMIDRMMLIGSARIVGARLDQQSRNEQGFTHLAPLLHTAQTRYCIAWCACGSNAAPSQCAASKQRSVDAGSSSCWISSAAAVCSHARARA